AEVPASLPRSRRSSGDGDEYRGPRCGTTPAGVERADGPPGRRRPHPTPRPGSAPTPAPRAPVPFRGRTDPRVTGRKTGDLGAAPHAGRRRGRAPTPAPRPGYVQRKNRAASPPVTTAQAPRAARWGVSGCPPLHAADSAAFPAP